MHESNVETMCLSVPSSQDALTEVLRRGAQRLLADAVEAEVADWLETRAHLKDGQGRQRVVRNGRLPARSIITALGPLEVTQPRVRDRRPVEEAEPFTSKILPPYLRRTKSIEQLIPWLYLRGISTGDMQEALGERRKIICFSQKGGHRIAE